ncbi:Glycosyltransferase involved in cell wall bisynthesis [Daejeonella rubra]|uniref:Glycosyltransferase involved in cell wall bisynthesis n=1 Tax=Daejeonella rubra TaxID=990371 RepID=A0A1G9WVX4_9SPHI|nr:glycosyltransferase [Daejeonella rubra]SDM88600.1 Glycosyltransferase involved in cell wall bisynthesis [Daejeonella rubra]
MIKKDQTPLVSIIFTSYNHAEFLQQALESILNQSYRNFELIVVDDCSTDGSREILLKYKNHENIKLHLLEKNTGSYVKSSNYGAQKALGEFLMFAQCDDFADPRQVELLLKALKENETVGVAYSRSNMVDKDNNIFADDYRGRERKFRLKCKTDTIISSLEMRRFLSFSCVLPNLSAALLRRELYVKVGGLPEKYLVAADWAFWLSLSELTNFYYLIEPLNNFRQHETTIRNKVKIQKQILEISTIFYEHIRMHRLSGKNAQNMKFGAGFVWFSFLFLGFNAWLDCFLSVYRETFKLDKFNIVYLIGGFLIYFKEAILSKSGY